MKVIETLFLISLLLGTTPSLAQLMGGETATLETPTGSLEGTLLCPYAKTKIPLVIIIAGSGPTDRNGNNAQMKNNALKLIADGLLNSNIATLRYDKRGVGKSAAAAIKENDLRFENYIEDASAWVKKYASDERFDEIIILGHSEGSLIGMIAAQKNGISKYISIAGAGYPAADILRTQLQAQPQTVLDMALPIIAQLEKGHTVSNPPTLLQALFRPSVQDYLISWMHYKPQTEIAKVSCPVLILQGSTDIQVSSDNAEHLAEANKQAQLTIIEGMNHILKPASSNRTQNIQTYNNPTLPLHQELMPLLVDFIEKKGNE